MTRPRTKWISRYNDMMALLRKHDISAWGESFLKDLCAIAAHAEGHDAESKVATLPKRA